MTSKTVAKAYSNGSSLLKLPPNNTFRIMVPFRNMCESFTIKTSVSGSKIFPTSFRKGSYTL